MKTLNFKLNTSLCLVLIIISISFKSFGQIKVVSTGKVGIGGVTNPTSFMELANYKWLRFNSLQSTAGLLFYETGTATESNVYYGAKIYYDGYTDRFHIITKQNNTDNYAISISRTYGCVAIGSNTPSYIKLDVNGDIGTYGTVRITSDLKFKTDVKPISNVIDNIVKIQPISFKYIKKESDELKKSLSTDLLAQDSDTLGNDNLYEKSFYDQTRYGVSAQELKSIFPDLVTEDIDGTLRVDYIGIIPLLINAIKEQQIQIKTIQQIIISHEEELINLEAQIKELLNSASKTKSTAQNIQNEPINGNEINLFQNTPNPFTQDTKIQYFVPDEISDAQLMIHDIQGKEIKIIDIALKGAGSITIKGSELDPGMYLYTLIVDNDIIDTKRMILTK